MRISSDYTNYTRHNIAFGYDKKLNKELKQRLNSYPDERWAGTMLDLNSVCNNLEKNIKETEKAGVYDEDFGYQDYVDLFLSQKEILTASVSLTFDDLYFADREYEHYHDKFVKNGKKDGDWRKEVCAVLGEWCCNFHKDIKQVISDVMYAEQDGVEEDFSFDETAPSKAHGKLGARSLLEEFTPKQSSPKGFNDVAGMDKLKSDLQNSIIEYINNPEQAQLDYEEYGKKIPKAILLYGPPGCGKTYITEALSSEIDTPLYMFNLSKAGSCYVNETSKNIKSAFDEAISISKKNKRPVLLFMDEIDSVAFDRNDKTWAEDIKQVASLLQSMDKAAETGVIILAATNKYNLLDPAVKRRFDNKTFVDVPDEESRKALIKKSLSGMKKGQTLLADDNSIDTISKELQGYSSDSICKISQQAALNALKRDRAEISVRDFEKAIEDTTEEKPDTKEYLSESDFKKKKNRIGFYS